MKKHKIKTGRRIITDTEWGEYLSLHRHTIRANIIEYNDKRNIEYDPRNIYSVLSFFNFMIKKGYFN